jgi:predicted nucleic acid-binding protein
MKAVFADTSFYVAVLNPHDVTHAKALQVGEHVHRPVLLTDFILLELGNALSGVGQRDLFSGLVRHLRANSNVRIIPASRDLLDRGIELFSHRADKAWSLTDCTSFAVMQEEELTDALTTDHHFEQAGFTALLR